MEKSSVLKAIQDCHPDDPHGHVLELNKKILEGYEWKPWAEEFVKRERELEHEEN